MFFSFFRFQGFPVLKEPKPSKPQIELLCFFSFFRFQGFLVYKKPNIQNLKVGAFQNFPKSQIPKIPKFSKGKLVASHDKPKLYIYNRKTLRTP